MIPIKHVHTPLPELSTPAQTGDIGRYRARVDQNGLVLTHPAGISFDLTRAEAVQMLEFLHVFITEELAAESPEPAPDSEQRQWYEEQETMEYQAL